MKKASNDIERIILNNIVRYGWHSNSVGMELDSAIFAYTVGFFHSFQHPELLVFGLSPTESHAIFTAAANLIERGCPLDTNALNDQLLAGRSCVSVEVPKTLYPEFVRSACWYYGGNGFPLYQVVWPSDEGHYPWHPQATDAFTRFQPVLGRYGSQNPCRSARTKG